MLTAYLTQTKRLLQNPGAPTSLYSDVDLTSWINTARGQLAGDAECIRNYASLALVANQRTYNFSSITLGSPSTGIQGVFKVNTVWYQVASGQVWIRPRPWEWFSLYSLNNPVPGSGPPLRWSQFGQGVNGTIWIDPLPNIAYTVPLDTVCYPVNLVDDTTVEAIPFPWTDSVPYFAAYLALLSAQAPARQADADKMLSRYDEFKNRARRYSTPSVLPGLYAQVPNAVRSNQLGQSGQGAG